MVGTWLCCAATCLAAVQVFTDEASYLAAADPEYYLEEFNGYPGWGWLPSIVYFGPQSGFSYAMSTPDGLWENWGAISTSWSNSTITISFTGAPVTSTGGQFYLTDNWGFTVDDPLYVDCDGTGAWTSAGNFLGFVSDGSSFSGITVSTDSGYFATVDHLYAGGKVIQTALTISCSKGGGIRYPGVGTFLYYAGDTAYVGASVPEPGYVWSGWSGSTTDPSRTLDLAMDRDYTISANYTSVLKTLYVDDDAPLDPGPRDNRVSDPNENGTAARPFDSIQEAIDVAGTGAKVVVLTGRYLEGINFRGKSITVTGLEGLVTPSPASYPVIDANATGTVVRFSTREGSKAVLEGFVLTGGTGPVTGALGCQGSSPVISHCLIVGNRGTGPNSGAIYCKDASPTIINCTISGNSCGKGGAGIYVDSGTPVVRNTIVWGNLPQDIVAVAPAAPAISYTDVGVAWSGAGNLVKDPQFAMPGSWETVGRGLVWVHGDYHLKSQSGRWDAAGGRWVTDGVSSPCIDAGDPSSPVGSEPAPNGRRINLGAYGGTSQASKSPN